MQKLKNRTRASNRKAEGTSQHEVGYRPRYIPINEVKDLIGKYIIKDMVGSQNRILAKKGEMITRQLIMRLQQYGMHYLVTENIEFE